MSTSQNFQTKWTIRQVVSWAESACPRESRAGTEFGLEIVEVLQKLGMGDAGLIAGFLQGLSPFNAGEIETIEAQFGQEVAGLCRRIENMRRLSGLLGEVAPGRNRDTADEENLRKMLIAMVDDVRVVQICLVNQLIVLRLFKSESVESKKLQARLTRDIYAPLANRLGIWQLKWELEDLAFRYLHPNTYQTLARALEEKRQVRELYIERLVKNIQSILDQADIRSEVQGRPKHIYSIWKKMQRKDLEFSQLWDLRGVRILVAEESDCYSALSTIHSNWKHVPEEFSDYIAMPKSNGYQSIHTVITGPENKSVEVQVRTYSMHEESELGVAAHWRYKEKLGQDTSIDSKVVWLRQLLEWKKEVMESKPGSPNATMNVDPGLPEAGHAGDERVYVFTPKGTIVDLPSGSTTIDFAYAIHSEVGHRTRGAKVDGKMVPLNYKLVTGEQVHIQTVKTGGPSRDWLRSDLANVKTNRARSRISQWFKQADYDQHVSEGRAMLEKELNRLGLEDLSYEKIYQKTHFKKADDLLAAIGSKDFKLSKALYPFKSNTKDDLESIVSSSNRPSQKQKKGSFIVHGVGNLLTHMAKCCQPIPGDEIIGFISSGRGVSIHRRDCNNIVNVDEKLQNRLVEVDWGQQSRFIYNLELEIMAFHRTGLLHDVTELLKASNADVLKVNMETDKEHITQLLFRLEISGGTRPEQLISALSAIQNVIKVAKRRLTN